MAGTAVPVRRATGVSNLTLGTLLFMTSEAMLFTGLASSFVVLRSQYANWPPMGQPRLPVEATFLNTLVLLASGVACERAARARDRAGAVRSLGIAWVLGMTFLLVQGREWVQLLDFGLSGRDVYGSLFYATVGVHALHVAVSLGILALAVVQRQRGLWGGDETSAMRTWWWFVVGVWPFLYTLVYLC